MDSWHGFCLFKEKKQSDLSFNKDISKNFDRDIFSQTAQKVLAARRKIVNFQVSIMAAWEMNASQGN